MYTLNYLKKLWLQKSILLINKQSILLIFSNCFVISLNMFKSIIQITRKEANFFKLFSIFCICFTFLFSTSAKAQSFIDLNKEFIELFDKGSYDKAIVVGEKALIQCEKEYGKVHINYAIALQNLADAYSALKIVPKAVKNYKNAIVVYISIYKTKDVFDIAIVNNSIGNLFFNTNEFDTALVYFLKSFDFFYNNATNNFESIKNISSNIAQSCLTVGNYNILLQTAEKVLPIFEKEIGVENSTYYAMFYYKGFSLYNLGEYEKAEVVYSTVLPLAEKLFGKINDEYAAVLKFYFRILNQLGKWKEAETALNDLLKIFETLKIADVNETALMYEEAGNFYCSLANFELADKYFDLALNVLFTAGFSNTDNYNNVLQSKAYAFYQAGKLMETKEALENLLKIYTNQYGFENEKNIDVLIVLSGAEVQLNLLSAAEEHALQGIQLINKIYKGNRISLANAKETLGMIYNKLGDSKKSIISYKEGIAILNKFLENTQDVSVSRLLASLLSNLGITYFEIGNYADAEIVLLNSLKIREDILGNTHPEYALSLINLSMVHLFQGRYTIADKMLNDALKIFLDRDLLNTNNFYLLINNIALLAEKTNMKEEAEKLYLSVLRMLFTKNVKNTATYSNIYSNLSILNFSWGKYDKVITYSTKALEYLEKGNNKNSKEYIKALNSLFVAYSNKMEYAKATEISKQLLSLSIKIMGDKAELTGIVYNNIAMMYLKLGNFEKAAEYLNISNDILLNNFKQNFYVLSEKEKLVWWDNQSYIFNLFPSLLNQFNIVEGKWVEAFINRQIQLKGFVLSSAKNTLNKARNSNNPALKKLLDEWQYNKDLLSKLFAIPVYERKLSTDSIEQKLNTVEKEINQLSAGTIELNDENITWQNVQQNLEANETAIEFVSYPFYRNNVYTDSTQYAAILISKTGTPKFIQLGTEKKLTFFMNNNSTNSKEVNIHRLYRSRLKKGNDNFIGDSVFNLVWQPLMPYLKNVKTVSFAPDGLLHKIAFNALPISQTKVLLDTFQLQQYSSIKQIASRSKEKNISNNSALLLGNINFSEANLGNGKSITYTSNNISWAQLPGTEKEVLEISNLFKKHNVKISTYSGANATEESFKLLNHHSTSIIHIATHVFFLKENKPKSFSDIAIRGESLFAATEDPLLRSGIILAGANKAWSGEKIPDNIEDGILSAFEISKMDLSNTNLVVLSACETALGDIQGTEGVFGLQRAFKMAGVKNLIVSLWQVPDNETVELMTGFYSNIFKGYTIRNAFYEAQKTMRAKYSPYSWAAFVLIE